MQRAALNIQELAEGQHLKSYNSCKHKARLDAKQYKTKTYKFITGLIRKQKCIEIQYRGVLDLRR